MLHWRKVCGCPLCFSRFHASFWRFAVSGWIGGILVGSSKSPYTIHDKAYFADQEVVDFVRPGLVITINSAHITSAAVISITYTLDRSHGLPLDAAGVDTPGVVSLAFIAAYIPKGQEQYVAYTTSQATGPAVMKQSPVRISKRARNTSRTQVAAGQYQYTFKAQAPAGFDPTVTNTVAVDGNRDLTAFGFGTSYAGATFNFVPNGSLQTVTRDVIRTEQVATPATIIWPFMAATPTA